MTINSHINVSQIDRYESPAELKSYDGMAKFYNWLVAQSVRFADWKAAYAVYSGNQTVAEIKAEQKPATTKTFTSRNELNAFFRQNGYTWSKIATHGEDEETTYGESYKWQLFSSDSRQVTVEEALAEINAK